MHNSGKQEPAKIVQVRLPHGICFNKECLTLFNQYRPNPNSDSHGQFDNKQARVTEQNSCPPQKKGYFCKNYHMQYIIAY